jgi:hypothetical protein
MDTNKIQNALDRMTRRWWFGVLHFPLLILSLYGLRLSFKK